MCVFFCFCHDSRTNIIFTDHFIELHHQIGRGGRLICRTLTQSRSPLHQPHLHTALIIVTKKLLFCSDRKGRLVKSFLDVYDVMDAYYYCVKVTMLQLKKNHYVKKVFLATCIKQKFHLQSFVNFSISTLSWKINHFFFGDIIIFFHIQVYELQIYRPIYSYIYIYIYRPIYL